ncbi:PIN domain-containing protein [Streptacidiphilus anmyonensis]|uniref:PIN domain-containing protein n=1 Tax=Streptacidiphilus anmyonensis TaxID=405782 RepID=UPI0006944109|nr:PIN domain-containing protein [Streptacidiphilus anmyonensis]
MAGAGGFLIDTSAVGRMMRPDVIEDWREQISTGQIGICDVTRLELLRTARSGEEFTRMRAGVEALYTWWPIPEKAARRALDYQERLAEDAEQGTLRLVGTAGLLLAATAAHHGLTLLHYDADLEAMGRLTGLPTRWLAEPGSIP